MKGLHDFIVKIDVEFHDTFKTEGGLELYANKDISAERVSNRFGKIVNTPVFHDTIIKPGYQVMIDPTILYKQTYRHIKQDSIHLMDKEEGLYKLDPKEIILYRESENHQWKGYGQNNLVEPVKGVSKTVKSDFIYIPEKPADFIKGKAKALFMNDNIDAKKGDELIISKDGGLPYWIEGKEFWWIRNIDIYAKNEQAELLQKTAS